jgi:hypothetical protein
MEFDTIDKTCYLKYSNDKKIINEVVKTWPENLWRNELPLSLLFFVLGGMGKMQTVCL